MSTLRFITWNCRSGSVSARLSQLAAHSPHVVFLQECDPAATLPLDGQICCRRINRKKGIALIVSSSDYQCVELEARRTRGRATIAAAVAGSTSFVALGIWARATDYVGDVLGALAAHARRLRSGPAVVMGDFNSGTRLTDERTLNRGHRKIIAACTELGLVSAYHAFHGLEHGQETHPTYFHQFKAAQPWHIDFCFVPASWASRLLNVQVIDGDEWTTRSDHRPLLVELAVSGVKRRCSFSPAP
jgi:endonuclease/exonuclease/phosphatase (EEP) superfamily protein YafD